MLLLRVTLTRSAASAPVMRLYVAAKERGTERRSDCRARQLMLITQRWAGGRAAGAVGSRAAAAAAGGQPGRGPRVQKRALAASNARARRRGFRCAAKHLQARDTGTEEARVGGRRRKVRRCALRARGAVHSGRLPRVASGLRHGGPGRKPCSSPAAMQFACGF